MGAIMHRKWLNNYKHLVLGAPKTPMDMKGGERKNQLDYVTINKVFRKEVLHCQTYQSADYGSNHLSRMLCHCNIIEAKEYRSNKAIIFVFKYIKYSICFTEINWLLLISIIIREVIKWRLKSQHMDGDVTFFSTMDYTTGMCTQRHECV